MDKDQLARRLMATFLDELEEHVQTLNRELLALKRAPAGERGERLRTLFRAAHSLKGAARSVNLGVIETEPKPWSDQPQSAEVTLPPLGVVWLAPAE